MEMKDEDTFIDDMKPNEMTGNTWLKMNVIIFSEEIGTHSKAFDRTVKCR